MIIPAFGFISNNCRIYYYYSSQLIFHKKNLLFFCSALLTCWYSVIFKGK